jgi:hypothetical protein
LGDFNLRWAGENRFLPDDDETPEESFDGDESTSKDETSERSPLPEKIDGRKIDARRTTMQPDRSKPEGEEHETETGEGEGPGGGTGTTTTETERGRGSGDGRKDDGNSDTGLGAKGGFQSKPSVPVRYRTFATDPDKGIYSLMVAKAGDGDVVVNLLVFTVGDDQKAPADIKIARHANGQSVPIVSPGVLGPIQFSTEQMQRFEVELSEPVRVAMEITAYEA